MVSVIVATYRRSDELKNALLSLATQSYHHFEIVLVDDNDDAVWNQRISSIVEDFKNRYPRIALQYIVNSPNQGSAKTRNTGIEASRGEYITFLDDDDLYLPDKIKNQVGFMKQNDLDYSITDLDLYDEKDRLIEKRTRGYLQDRSSAALLQNHLMYHMTGTDTMMFRKSYLTSIGGFAPIDVGDEFYLMLRAIDGNGSFGHLPRCDIKAYVHTGNGGLSSGDGKIRGENALYAFKKQYFPQIDRKTKRYIRMRHYAVLAFAEIRRKNFFPFFINACKSFFCSPIACIKIVLARKV